MSNLSATIDLMGEVKTQIDDLQAYLKELQKSLIELAPGAYEGEAFTLKISVYDRDSLDMEAVRAKLSPQFIAAHTTTATIRKHDIKPVKNGGRRKVAA